MATGAPLSLRPVLAGLLGLALLWAPTPGAAQPSGPTAEEMRALMREGEVPGLSLAVVADGEIGPVMNLGVRDAATAAPVDGRTVFEAASLSKPVVAYAVLKLADAGKLRLDASIAGYADGGALEADPRWRRITLWMLLTHTSGLPNELRPGETAAIGFEPGSRLSYSGVGYGLLQQAIEAASGQGFEAHMRSAVFRPLGMASSSFAWRPDYERRKATGHDAAGRPREMRRPAAARAASSLHTTAGDYARFLRAVLDGKGLSSSRWADMASAQAAAAADCVVCVGRPAGEVSQTIAWGLGWGIEPRAGGPLIFHWGENNGDTQAFVIGDPVRRNGLVMLTNSGNGLSIAPAITARMFPGEHPIFAWMGYEAYDSLPRTAERRAAREGAAGVLAEAAAGRLTLTEAQWNRTGYRLLARGRTADAVLVFEANALAHPRSANVHDSLGEAYLAAGRKAEALASYRRSLELDPTNGNAREVIAKLDPDRAR
jgi:CubicO group peptidase (beta-lactamase class C family)